MAVNAAEQYNKGDAIVTSVTAGSSKSKKRTNT